MKELNEIKSIIRDHKNELAEEYGVSDIGIFGSTLSGEVSEGSDIDVLVDFGKPIGLIRFMSLQYHLEDLLKEKVDLVPRKALKPYLGQTILQEVQYV